jgi:hypothetical protein
MYGFNIKITGQMPASHDDHARNLSNVEMLMSEAVRYLHGMGFVVDAAMLNGREFTASTPVAAVDTVDEPSIEVVSSTEPDPSVIVDLSPTELEISDLDAATKA